MGIEFFIALKYIKSKHRLNFITIISYLSTAGIAIGVAALIVVLSVFNGFSSLVTSYLISLDPHVRIEASSASGLENIQGFEDMIKNESRVKAYSPYVVGKVVLMHREMTKVVTLKGVDPRDVNSVYDIGTYIRTGTSNLEDVYGLQQTPQSPKVLVGFALADGLSIETGDTITIVSPSNIDQMLTANAMPLTLKVIVAGIYYSKSNDYDTGFMFTSLDAARYLLGYDNNFQGYEIRLNNSNDAESVKSDFTKHIDTNNYTIKTWYDLHRELFTVMKIERWVAYLLLSMIILVAVFNILASLTMSVIEKKRDIGILRTIGLEQKSIRKIYFYQGMLIGTIGTIVGFALGYVIYWLQVTYVLYPLDPTQFKISALPMEIRWSDFLAVGIASLGLSLAASYIPAKRASKVDPLEAIRWE